MPYSLHVFTYFIKKNEKLSSSDIQIITQQVVCRIPICFARCLVSNNVRCYKHISQASSSLMEPEQNFPPYCGNGFSHDRRLWLYPWQPEVTRHVLHEVQSANPPSMAAIYIYRKEFFWNYEMILMQNICSHLDVNYNYTCLQNQWNESIYVKLKKNEIL